MSKCWRCSHVGQEIADDVACCNCCENYEFFDPIEDPFNEDDYEEEDYDD